MAGARASLQASVATTIWMLIWRLVYGGACIVDGIAKLGLAFDSPAARATGDFQPSPFGAASAVFELVFGTLLLVGLQSRAVMVALAAHVALALAMAVMRGQELKFEADLGMTSLVLVLVLVFGAGTLSVDGIWPDLLAKTMRRFTRERS